MARQTKNYADSKKKKKMLVLAVCSAALALLLAFGLVAAFYSDTFTTDNNITTGTLQISGSYTFYVNGEVTAIDDIDNLNPGDVIVIKGNITNQGNKSAWIRDRIVINSTLLAPYFEAFDTELTQSQIALGGNEGNRLNITDGVIVTSSKVANGTGAGAETESGQGYNYLDSANYSPSITLHFLPTAGNETQNTSFNVSVTCQALQFRNNNSALPLESAWSGVVAVNP